MSTKKEIAKNQRILYDDAVANNMFQAAVPSFEEFQRRLEGSGYQKMVYDNYRKHNVQGTGFNSIEEFRGKFGGSFYSDENKQQRTHGVQNMVDSTLQAIKNNNRYTKLKQQKQQKDFGLVNIGTNKTIFNGNADNIVKDDATGTYLTSDGDETENINYAQSKQAILDQQNNVYKEAVDKGEIPSILDVMDKNGNYDLQENIGKNGTYLTKDGQMAQLEKQLEDAYKRKKEIETAISEYDRVNGNPLLSYSAPLGGGNSSSEQRQQMNSILKEVDNEIKSLEAVTRHDLKSKMNEVDGVLRMFNPYKLITTGVDFVFGKNTTSDMQKALKNTAGDARTWDFGLSDFAVMGQMERIKAKMDKKIPLTQTEQTLLRSKVGADAVAALEDEKMGNAYRWAKIAGESAPFMLDFLITGGNGGITKAMGTAALKYAAKRGVGTIGKNILKYTGIVAGDVIGSYAMASTEQAFKTGADIMQRHMGTLYQDKDGNYKFGTFDENGNLLHEGGESIGKSLYKGLTSAMVENYTEKFFHHTHFKRFLAEKMKGTKLGDLFANVGKAGWYADSKKWMKKFGIDGFFEEVMEEEIGTPLHAILDGEGSISDLADLKKQMDIIGGMAISVGSMSAMHLGATQGMKVPGKIYNRAQYYRFRHKVDLSDSECSRLFGDSWDSLRDNIDNTTNEQMSQVLCDIIRNRDNYSREQVSAAVHYAVNLMKMRGYNLAKTAEMNARETTGEQETEQEKHDNGIDNAYSEGHNAEGEDTHTIQVEADNNRKSLAEMLGITEQQLSAMGDEELESLAGQNDALDIAIYDYQMSDARYQGVMDNANDKIDLAAQQASQAVDLKTDKSRGTVRSATIKATKGQNDYEVFIVGGNLATHDDGTIDISGSDQMILYYDPTTNMVDHADANRFASVGNEQAAEEVKGLAVTEAKEKAIREVAGIIDGALQEGDEFITTDADGNQHTYEILADNGDGTVMITYDGNVEYQPYSLADLQQMKDIEDQKKYEAAKAEREQLEQQRQQNQTENTTETTSETEESPVVEEEGTNSRLEGEIDFSSIINDKGNVVIASVEGETDQDTFVVGEYNNKKSGKKKYKVVSLNSDGTTTKPRLIDADKVSIMGEMSLDEYKQALVYSAIVEANSNTESSAVEDNSGITDDDLPPLPDNVTINGDGTYSVDGQVQGENQEQGKNNNTSSGDEIKLEDGTVVPMLEDGNPDFSKLTAEQTAELYDSQFGEDADQVINGWVSTAKKALDKANGMSVTGSNFVEQRASAEAKKKAVAEAKAAYDSASAILEAYKNRQLAKEEGTPEGRRNLIDKAKRKYNRLKGKVKDNAEELAKLYDETVGSLLHHLYDSTGINVLDTAPNTVDEYVASSVAPHSLGYEGTENGKGVKQETGLSRSDFSRLGWLAKEGNGTTLDEIVHRLWENRPSNLEDADTQDIRNALINLITSGQSAFESRDYVQNQRIAEAEKLLEQERDAAENRTESAPSDSENEAENTNNEADNEESSEGENEDRLDNDIELPEDSTDEQPLGAPRDSTPFTPRDNGQQNEKPTTPEEEAEYLELNRVEGTRVVDDIIGKKTRKALERIAKMMGAKIQWQYTDYEGNGWYDKNTNTVYLTLDSSITEGVQFIFGHEMTHEIRTKNPEAYEELKNLVKEVMGEDVFDAMTDATEKLYNNHKIYYSEGRPAYEEEVVADQLGRWFREADYAETLALKMSHPLLAKLREIVKRIKMALTGTEHTGYAQDVLDTIDRAYKQTGIREAQNTAVQEGEGGQRLSLRTKPAPKKTITVYKLMRLGEDGELYPLFIGNAEVVRLKMWYDADSPALKDLKSLSSNDYVGKRKSKKDGVEYEEQYNYGVYIVNNESGEAMSLKDFKKAHKGDKRFSRIQGNPNVEAINWATDNGYRWIKIEEKKKGQSRYGGENRSYYNYGINGSGSVSTFAMRPGWHAGSLPTMRQIGKGSGKNLRDDTFVWVEGEIPADIDYNEEAQKNADKDIPDHIPTDGFYLKATNANKEASQADKVGWYVAGAFMPKRIMSDKETREVIDQWNKEHPNDEPVEYDWKRESGKDFNAETMSLEDTTKSSLREYSGNGMDVDGNYDSANAKKYSLKDIKPIGVGSFGNVYDQFKHNAKAAIDFLTKLGSGEAIAALHHKDVGDIDLVWGEEGTGHSDGYGLSKLVKYHPEVLDDLQGVLDGMHVTKESKNRVNLESDTHKAGIRLAWNGERKTWLLTAYKKATPANDKRTDTAVTSLGGDTALSQAEDSAAKIDNSSETAKGNEEKFSLKDQEYLKAVEDGDMDKAQKMVNEAAEAAGYSTDSSYQGTSAFNGSAPWGNGYFLTKEERKEAWDNGEFEGESTLGDYINDDIDGGNLEELTNAASYRAADPMRKEAINNVRKAIQDKSKTITMYRSVPANVKEGSFRNGDWITPSRSYAVDNAQLHGWGNDYNIIEQEVPVDDVWFDGNDIAEWGYGREEDYINDTDFAYKNTKNNRKQLDAVTYDDNGNVIPLSQRFNPDNSDTRYSLKEVNNKFNDRLEELIKNPNQKDKILRLGHASTFLQDGGIADADIELEFDKLKRKAKQGYAHEHPFDLTDVKDLPLAIANPISVFDNTNGRNDGQVILTELKKGDSHFIVAIQTEDQHRKGGIILQVNKIATLFPKDAKGIVNWFIQGKATNVDKEKALHYIEALQNHPGTTISSEELETAAKVIKDYESSKENREKFSLKDDKTLVGVHNESGLHLYDYDANKEGDRKRAFDEAVNSSDNIRFSLAGVRGAANLDKAEEVTTRLDNLNVARQMEEAKKDAKAIKMATGWERGADGKWRYEMPDAKMKDTIDIGGHIVKRFEDDILWTGGKLGKHVDAHDLFKAYPQLKDVRLDTDEIVNDMPSNGAYNPKTNTITIHATDVEYLNSILNHEIQHAIQHIEGFAKGGSPESIRSQIQEIIDNETDASDYAKQKLKRYATLQMQAARLEAYKTFVKSDEQYFKDKAQEYYWDAMNELDNDENSKLANEYPDDKTAKEVAESGYHVDEAIKELKRLGEEYKKEIPKGNMDALEKVSKLTSALKDKSDYELYQALAGEVEARNVSKRMGMTADERRNSLAAETEDVAREDQIFLGVDNNDIRYSLKEVNDKFNDDLDRYVKGEMKSNEMLHIGNPNGVMRIFLPDLPIVMRQRILTKGTVKKHNVAVESLADMPKHLAHPIFVFKRSDNALGVLTEMKDRDGKNVCVAIELNRQIQDGGDILEVNDIRSVHGRDVSEIVYPIVQNGTLKWADKEKGLAYLSSASQYVQQEIYKQDLETAAKIVKDFENPSISGEKLRDEQKYSLRVDRYQGELAEWKKANNLPKNAERPSVPVRETGESAVDFMNRVKQYRNDMALWKTAPQYEDHLLSDDTAQGQFNTELQRGSVLARIALQDSMLAIRKAQEAIMHEVGVDKLNIAEDAYTAENRSHGKGKNEFEEYNDEFLQPLRKSYNKMMKDLGKSYDNVKIYMMAKHGLERNAHMAFMKALEKDFDKQKDRIDAYNQYKADVDKLLNDSAFSTGQIDFITYRRKDDSIRMKYAPSYLDHRYDKMGITMDYSGLSALFEGSDFEEAAADLVKDVESNNLMDTIELWDATNAATKKILRDSYKAGMMTKDVYEYVRGMYNNYIPLRGWGDTNADQVWNYMGGGKGVFSQTLKKAKGRGSLADDPIAYIENMAESGILLNNKNWVKQHLLLLAQNHPTSLLNVSKAWYIKTVDAQGNEQWIPASPNITDNMTSQQVEAELAAFEQKMEQMKQKGDATQKREHLEITYPQTNSEEREHEVRVMKDGEEYVIYINGDPQLAQAMNNTRSQRVREGLENSISQRVIARLGRFMAAVYTSLSPLFIPSNFARDTTMTLASTAIRENRRYNWLLRKNMALHWNMYFMVRDYQDGTLREKVRSGNATKSEQMFYDYMMNGGETGFVNSMDIEDLKRKFKNELKDMNRMALNPRKVGHFIMDEIETLNRAIEASNRFAIYRTSIDYGRSIEEAVNDAKNVTLNFNRKGTGEHGWQTIRNLYLFINPAVQSLQTLGALAKHHPVKFSIVTTLWMASGVLVPMVNAGLMELFGGDDDKDRYWSFSKWDRRNNFILWVPGTKEFIKIPLAQEFRGFFGVGDMIASKLWGGEKAKQSWEDYGWDLMGQIIDMLPLDPTGYNGNLAVSMMPNPIRPLFELAFNIDFTGKPLFKDSDYNKYDPNFTKAYAGTPDWLVRVSRMVNSVGNDYPDFQQNDIDKWGSPRFNPNNPAVIHHLLSSYLGGAYTMGSQVLGVATKLLNGDSLKVADIPIVSKFVSNPDDRPVSRKQGDEFWTMMERHDRAANTLSKLKKKAKIDGDYSTLEVFFDSDQYKQYKIDDKHVKKYKEEKKAEVAKETGDDTYAPPKTTADDIYKAHTTQKDDFEDMKLTQLYSKISAYNKVYWAKRGLNFEDAEKYYQENQAAIDAAKDTQYDVEKIKSLKRGFLSNGKDNYNADVMTKIREERKNALAILEKANRVVVERQKAKAEKK